MNVATCQFPVAADIHANLRFVKRQMRVARERGAHVAHFPEGALSGYAGSDLESFRGYDWGLLREATLDVLRQARRLRIWVVLGSAHPLTGAGKPHNCLYMISPDGKIIDRYDKMFCSGDPDGQTGDLAHYSPGSHFSTWDINGITCGALICYDYRFPELYREYKRRGVELVFHSFHAGNVSGERVEEMREAIGEQFVTTNGAATHSYPGITMPAAMTTAAAQNYVWISCPNSSAPQSLWPAFAVRADGVTTGRLHRNVPGVLVTTVDTSAPLYDSTAAWRGRALGGVLHSGDLPDDPRSADRTAL